MIVGYTNGPREQRCWMRSVIDFAVWCESSVVCWRLMPHRMQFIESVPSLVGLPGVVAGLRLMEVLLVLCFVAGMTWHHL